MWCTCDEDLTVWVTSLWPTIAYSSDVIAIRYTSNFKSDVQSILHGRYSIGNFSHLSDIKPKPCSFWVFCCYCLHFPAMQAVPLILFEVPLSSIWNDNLFSRNSCWAEFINQETSVKKVFYILSKYFCINTKCNWNFILRMESQKTCHVGDMKMIVIHWISFPSHAVLIFISLGKYK